MRLSDILRSKAAEKPKMDEIQNFKQPEPPSVPKPEQITPPKPIGPSPFRSIKKYYRGETSTPVRRAPAFTLPLKQQPKINIDSNHAKEVYGKLIQQSENFVLGFSSDPITMPDLEEICESIEHTVEILESQPSKILELIDRSTPEDYLPGHIVNVVILAIAVSQQLKWPKEIQRAVGVGALLHDAGMAFHRSIYLKSSLTPEERKELRKIPQQGFEKLKEFLNNFSQESKDTIEKIITQCQERISGEGYPSNLRGSQICKEAQVVGLCDTYEAISHPRVYRNRKLPHDTLKYLIELSGEIFDGLLIKSLWETLSLYPPGSFVQLNTGEIAKIIDINKELPTRPVVKSIITSAGEKIETDKIIDLSQTPGIIIQKAVDECSLDLADSRLILELRAQKWWVK